MIYIQGYSFQYKMCIRYVDVGETKLANELKSDKVCVVTELAHVIQNMSSYIYVDVDTKGEQMKNVVDLVLY